MDSSACFQWSWEDDKEEEEIVYLIFGTGDSGALDDVILRPASPWCNDN